MIGRSALSARASALVVGVAPMLLTWACAGASDTSSSAATPHSEAAQVAEPRSPDPTGTSPPTAPSSSESTAPGNAPPAHATGAQRKTSRDGRALGTRSLPSKIGARHVLVQWMGADRAGKSVLRSREQAMVVAQEVLRRALAGEDLGRLAVEYSDEPNAGPRGGSLGRFGKGQMVAGFEAVAFDLEVGQISDIVETPFGFHVIQRTE